MDEPRREPVIRISYDQMEAYIMLPMISADETYTLDELMPILERNRVTFGIEEAVLSDMIEKRIYGREVVFAHGQKPIDGMDGEYEFNFDYNLSKKPQIRPDGSVDYWNIHTVEIVKKGQIIAKYNPPIAGRDGKDVTGRVIMAKKGRPLPPLVGRGFEMSADGTVYTASCDGKIEKHKNRVLVLAVYEISGNVDMSTGNIDFKGDVIVHGDVKNGANIRATKSITIDGTVEDCYLESGGDMIIRGGVIGGDKARIISKGNIFAKFIEYSYVQADGFIEADSAVNCTVISNDKVLFKAGYASIVGGKVYGCAGIEVSNLGNETGTRTEVHVGIHKKIRQQVSGLGRVIGQKQQLLDNINAGVKQIEEIIKNSTDSASAESLEEKKLALIRARIEKQADITKDKEELSRLESIIERSSEAIVRVSGNVYEGVEVTINDSRVVTKSHVNNIEFVERDDKVVMMSAIE